MNKRNIVAIASSTGGPKALQSVIPVLPENLEAPVVVVQHMPEGFTSSLAERLNSMSKMRVKEARDGDVLENGCVYIAKGGIHLHIRKEGKSEVIRLLDGPTREGVKPCANFMYESLASSGYERIVCVVMTGMGADGTQGIKALKEEKEIVVIAQNQETSTIYGMPKNVVMAGLADKVVSLDKIAFEIQNQLNN